MVSLEANRGATLNADASRRHSAVFHNTGILYQSANAISSDDQPTTDAELSRNGLSPELYAILLDDRKLIIANVGDSRVVLCRNGKAKQNSADHKPKKEKELVESRGGFVTGMLSKLH